MFCPKCGLNNDDNAYKCVGCGEVLQHPSPQPAYSPPASHGSQQVPNYLTQAILVTLLCCPPLGIPAIVFASQVNGHMRSGNFPAAVEASNKAKMFCWISFGLGLAILAIYVVVGIANANVCS